MTGLKTALFTAVILGLVSCAASQPSRDERNYLKGYHAAWEYAKEDVREEGCFWYPGGAFAYAREHKLNLQEQGRSEAYIRGFYDGYQTHYQDFYDLHCR